MLNWSLKLFRVRGIQLAVHSSFFLLLAYVGWEGWNEAGATGMGWTIAVFLAFFTCVVLHELGHSLTAMRFGVGVRRILLMPIGGMAEFDSIPRQPSRELLITLAGPAVNFVIAGLLWFYVRTLPDNGPQYSADGFFGTLFLWNLMMGCFNLLPAFPMDGGRILRALLATRMPYLRATRWAANLGKVVCVVGIVAALSARPLGALAGIELEPMWLLAVLFGFIFFAGQMEYRATLRREQEDAHWQRVLAQLHPPLEEPPILAPRVPRVGDGATGT